MTVTVTSAAGREARDQDLAAWLQRIPRLKNRRWRLTAASADASFRRYLRLHHPGGTLVVMDAPPDREALGPWLDIRDRLAAAEVKVPEVYAADEMLGFALIEDFGAHTLHAALHAGGDRDKLYAAACDTLLAMQQATATAGLAPYDESRLGAELDLFPTWFLHRHLGIEPGCDTWDQIEQAFRLLLNAALGQRKTFVHRDYHSRNLMVLGETTGAVRLGVIDFQDAVLGPVTYDLVSLLKDCYVPHDNDWRQRQRTRHWQRLDAAGLVACRVDEFARGHELMGVQRHLKVLGIFCRLCYRDGKTDYLQYLPHVLDMTLDGAAQEPALAEFARWLKALCRGRDLTAQRLAGGTEGGR